MPAQDSNYDSIIKQMEDEVDQIQAQFKSEESKILDNIVRLTGTTGSTVGQTATAYSESNGSRGSSHFGKVKPLTESPEDILVDQIDSQLGGFYGSMELRDSLKEAQSRMQAVLSVLQRVREFVRSPFVRLEIEHLQHNIFTLQKVFMRMSGSQAGPLFTESDKLDSGRTA
ncbi:hypothetical protein GCK32_008947 [Trichostrongylus colubriformis]|uniref:Uncharacterized protein n=1 Tax=Trichostrongylus colubriformis TaxID=6319 RepID=A0AAN8FLF4_TRICO